MTTILLGPQRFTTTVGATVRSLGLDGPIAMINSGWEERESEDAELAGHLDGRGVNLQLHHRMMDVLDEGRALRRRGAALPRPAGRAPDLLRHTVAGGRRRGAGGRAPLVAPRHRAGGPRVRGRGACATSTPGMPRSSHDLYRSLRATAPPRRERHDRLAPRRDRSRPRRVCRRRHRRGQRAHAVAHAAGLRRGDPPGAPGRRLVGRGHGCSPTRSSSSTTTRPTA